MNSNSFSWESADARQRAHRVEYIIHVANKVLVGFALSATEVALLVDECYLASYLAQLESGSYSPELLQAVKNAESYWSIVKSQGP